MLCLSSRVSCSRSPEFACPRPALLPGCYETVTERHLGVMPHADMAVASYTSPPMGWGATDWIAVAGVAQVGVLSAAALYARRQVREARELRSVQTRPYVIVYIELNRVARSLLDLVVENIGQTPAQNVSIKISPTLKSTMASPPGDDRVNDWVALKEGIPYLAPSQRMTHLLDSAISRYSSDLPRKYEVTVNYTDVPTKRKAQPASHSETYWIDVGVWFGSHYTTEYGIHDVAEQLKKAATAFDRWTEGFDGIRVYTGAEIKERRAAFEKLVEEQRLASDQGQQSSFAPGSNTVPKSDEPAGARPEGLGA